MKKIMIPIFAAMGMLMLAAPASAAPSYVAIAPQASSMDVVQIQHRRHHRDRHHGNRYERRGGHHYYRGHRGYRHARPGYRRHGDYWFPPAAFALGAVVGGAIAAQEPPVRYRPRGNAHIQWCYDNYRSYRASDNSFQPFNGPRRQCRSPYG